MLQVTVSKRAGHDLATTMQTVAGIQNSRKNSIPEKRRLKTDSEIEEKRSFLYVI